MKTLYEFMVYYSNLILNSSSYSKIYVLKSRLTLSFIAINSCRKVFEEYSVIDYDICSYHMYHLIPYKLYVIIRKFIWS